MKTIKLKTLKLQNFKGVSNFTLNADCKNTTVLGTNEAGKTSLIDAFHWVLYGKNSENQKDFNIKTLDKENKSIPRLEHVVICELVVNGELLEFSRIYKEKWTKKRGSEFEEMTGHETIYTINSVPVSQGDYTSKVNEILNEEISKTITDVWYFNRQMKWNERREILSKLVGEFSDEEIASKVENNNELLELINLKVDLSTKREELSAKRKRLKSEIEEIDPRISEAKISIIHGIDFEQINAEIDINEKKYIQLDEHILDLSKKFQSELDSQNLKRSEKNNLILSLSNLSNKIEMEHNTKNNSKRAHVQNLASKKQTQSISLNALSQRVEFLNKEIDFLNKENQTFVSIKNEIKNEIFVLEENQTSCQTCKRPLNNADEIQNELSKNFEKNKTERIERINENGLSNIGKIEQKQKELVELNSEIKKTKKEIEKIEKEILDNSQFEEIKERTVTIEEIELQNKIDLFVFEEIKPNNDQHILIEQRKEIQIQIDSLKKEASKKFINENQENRIAELEKNKKIIANEIAQIERVEIQIENFGVAKMTEIENRVNSMFGLVKFKMFENQINGGVQNVCYCMINGVPFSDLNKASQINAGMDIVETLQKNFEVCAPVFVDNKESVVNLLTTSFQTISLVVSESHKQLTVI